MKLTLVSKDRELFKLCKEVLASLGDGLYELLPGNSRGEQPESDLYIWDYEAAAGFPDSLEWSDPGRHFFLVQRKDLAAFREESSLPDLPVLLKPVTRPRLEIFMQQVIAGRVYVRPNSSISSLRADRDEVLQCLIQANLKLQEYDQDRTNFLARAVHDFRAPLTAVTGYCGLLLGEQLGPVNEDQQEVLQRMQHSAQRLSRMANAMFQLSIGRHVESRPNLQKGDLRDCIDQALHELMALIDEKRIEISVDCRPAPERLYFERSQMEQVLVNLLDNACRFTPKFGAIEIRGYPFFWERRVTCLPGLDKAADRRNHDQKAFNAFRVDIRDSGPGIPVDHLDRIFEEYTYYAGGHDRSGAGLGLAICKMILERHQGRIWAESSPAGAIFSFVLPLQTAEFRVEGKDRENSLYAGVS